MSTRRQHPRFSWAPAALLALSSCGGGAPLLHPAHTLRAGRVTAGAGVSGTFVLGDAAETLEAGQSDGDHTTAESAVLDASIAPGIAPWVSSRVGLGVTTEAGLLYSGRAVRLDARHAFEGSHVALSVGAGVSAILARQRETPPSGWGFDVPLLVGWRSDASLVQAWLGMRAGYESIIGRISVATNQPSAPIENVYAFDAKRYWGSALVGLAVGVDPIRVALELDASYFQVSSSTAALAASFDRGGWALTPGGALLGHF